MTREAAVLVTGFNRPEMLRTLLKFLSEKSRRIYVSLDIPEVGDNKNQSSSLECREIVAGKTFLLAGIRVPQEHEGCFPGVSNAIDWAFEQEDRLIIIEDDIQISDKFLTTMDMLLEDFKDIDHVGSIAGTNLVPKSSLTHPKSALRLSDYTSSWGWATWKRSWQHFNEDLVKFPEGLGNSALSVKSSANQKYWEKVFADVANKSIDSWAYRWLYSNLIRNKKTLVLNANLVLNRGFGEGATHTNDESLPWWLPRSFEEFEIDSKGVEVKLDEKADEWMENFHFRTGRLQVLRATIYSKYPTLLGIRRYITRKGTSHESN